MNFCRYETEEEKQAYITDMEAKGFILAEEHNITTGKFLGFFESEEELSRRQNIVTVDAKGLKDTLDIINTKVTNIKTDTEFLKAPK